MWLATIAAGLASAGLEGPTHGRSLWLPFFLALSTVGLRVLPVRFHFGSQTHNVDLTGIPIVVGAILVAPWQLMLAESVAMIIAEILRPKPRSLVRATFNPPNTLLGVFITIAVVIVVHGGGVSAPQRWFGTASGWLAILLGALTFEVVTNLGVVVAMTLSGGLPGVEYFKKLAAQIAFVPLVVAAITDVSVACYGSEHWTLLILAGPASVLGWWYCASERMRARFSDLQALYAFSKALGDVSERPDVLSVALRETRSVLHCGRAEICVIQPEGLIRYQLDKTGAVVEEVIDGGSLEAGVISSQSTVLLAHGSDGRYLVERGFKDAMLTPMSVGGTKSAVLAVAERDGGNSTFTKEDEAFFVALAAHLGTSLTSSNHLDHLRRSVAEREHQAYHDGLTGLANRTLFMNVVAKALENSGGNRMVAVVLMDLDGFKEINDALGHHTGDEVLKVVAQRVSTGVREHGLAARLGGDEYAFMVAAAASVDEVVAITEKLMTSVGAPMEIENIALTVRASVGIALAPVHGLDANTLLKKADVAMYAAKSSARRINVYDRSMDNSSARRLALATDLGKAIDHDELDLWFQPVADVASGKVAGFEALLRWPHPALGFIPPDEFIPIAEQTGLIEPLTWWVMKMALAELRRWRDDGFEFDMAVNVSVRSLLDAAMVDRLAEMVASFDLVPGNVTLEITESSMMVELERSEAVLRSLSDMGFRIAIDDFGTGYSSLSRLKVLPVHVVKIDRAFIKNITFDKGDQAIVKSIIDLARVMGHQIVAEGIEDLPTWSRLASLGCDLGQGYYFARPMLARDCRRWVLARQTPSIAPVRSLGLRRIEGA